MSLRATSFLSTLAILLLVALPDAGAQQFAGTSFEEPEARGGQYTDTGEASIDHDLVNNAGEPLVDYTSTGSELGFDSFYFNTRNGAGLTDGDFAGVTDFTGTVSNYPDGSQGFQMSDTDGKMTTTLDEVALTGQTNPHVSLQYFINEDGYESDDMLRIFAVVDGGTEITLVQLSDTELEDNAGEFLVAEANLSGNSTAQLKFELDSNGSDEAVYFDDVQFTEGPRQRDPSVQFTASSTSASEGDGTITFDVSIMNPNGMQSSVDVVFDSGSSSATETDDFSYSPENIVFPATATDGDTQTITVTLNDDSEIEGTETAQFDLANATNTQIGAPGTFDLSIADNDQPSDDLIINEILADPPAGADPNNDGTASTSDDEFVEIYNTTGSSIDLSGYQIFDDNPSLRHTFPEGTMLPANTSITVFGGGDPEVPGLEQAASSGNLGFNNGGDTVTLRNAMGDIAAQYTYGGEGGDNQSLARNPDFTGSFVQHENISSNAVAFSPGQSNEDGSSLPVEFAGTPQATIDGSDVTLRWATLTEENNLGFYVQHQRDGQPGWTTAEDRIDSKAQSGNSSSELRYDYTVRDLAPGAYTFRVRQVDTDATESFSQLIEATVEAQGFTLQAAMQNPFRGRTELTYSAEDAQRVEAALYNSLGQRVRTLEASGGRIVVEAGALASGLYFVRLTDEQGRTAVQTLTLAR